MHWLVKQWPYAALLVAGFLILLLPFMAALGLSLALIYLQLPLYMIHQFEEHNRDRFRTFANQVIGRGKEAFTPGAIFFINSIGVWGVDLLALYLAFYVHLAFGLIAIYLPLVNAVTHIVMGVALRRYNPGLWTAALLFLPLGGWALAVVSAASRATWGMHVSALVVAILVHVAIMIYVKARIRRLS